ncbi:MAG: hypothetical protein ACRDUW_10385, partial [Pseudonocardiaceae bacterium]
MPAAAPVRQVVCRALARSGVRSPSSLAAGSGPSAAAAHSNTTPWTNSDAWTARSRTSAAGAAGARG